VVAGFTALVLASALLRGVPPEPNWWAPAALVVIVGASLRHDESGPRFRSAMLATVLIPSAIACAHALHPFLPLPAAADPTARLHGWRAGEEPVAAPGVGPYGAAAERCVYRDECDEIISYFNDMRPDMKGRL
jgi:hypothetical protein